MPIMPKDIANAVAGPDVEIELNDTSNGDLPDESPVVPVEPLTPSDDEFVDQFEGDDRDVVEALGKIYAPDDAPSVTDDNSDIEDPASDDDVPGDSSTPVQDVDTAPPGEGPTGTTDSPPPSDEPSNTPDIPEDDSLNVEGLPSDDEPPENMVRLGGIEYSNEDIEALQGLVEWSQNVTDRQAQEINMLASGDYVLVPKDQAAAAPTPASITDQPSTNGNTRASNEILADLEQSDPEVATLLREQQQQLAEQQAFVEQQQQAAAAAERQQLEAAAREAGNRVQETFGLSDDQLETLLDATVQSGIIPNTLANSTSPVEGLYSALEKTAYMVPEIREFLISGQVDAKAQTAIDEQAKLLQENADRKAKASQSTSTSGPGAPAPTRRPVGEMSPMERQQAIAEEIRQRTQN